MYCTIQHSYAAFTHVRLTTRFRMESLYKSIFVLSRSCARASAEKFPGEGLTEKQD